jgi:3-hydroxybutyryl-CoA dehydratase
MKTYTFDEIQVGQEESFTAVIESEHMEMFRKITGDSNPLHCDEGYAKERGYGGRVVYGMLTASYLSTLAGMYLPGQRSLIHEVEVKFTKALVLVGSTNLTIHGRVEEKNDTFSRLVIKVTVMNESGDKILRGTMKVGVAQ